MNYRKNSKHRYTKQNWQKRHRFCTHCVPMSYSTLHRGMPNLGGGAINIAPGDAEFGGGAKGLYLKYEVKYFKITAYFRSNRNEIRVHQYFIKRLFIWFSQFSTVWQNTGTITYVTLFLKTIVIVLLIYSLFILCII